MDPTGNVAATSDGPARTDPGRSLRWLLALYLAAAACVAVQRTVFATENNFLIFRAAAAHLADGRDLYAAYPAEHADHFKYSPTFALLFAPFALLPAVPGYILWAAACAYAVFAGLARALPPGAAVVALGLSALSVVGDLQRAQSNALCAGLMILAFVALERGTAWRAAIAIAAATFVKLFPIVAVALALYRPRKMRTGLVVAAVLLAGAALPLLVTPPSVLATQYRSWAAILSSDAAPHARYGTGGADVYAGIMGLFNRWWGVRWPDWPVQLAGGLLLAAPLAARRASVAVASAEGAGARLRFLASILVFCVLFNHRAESPSYSIAMIGAALWFAASERTWWRIALVAGSLVVVDLMSTDLMPRAWYAEWYVPNLVKTIPLIPLWAVMQLELLGVIPNAGAPELSAAGDPDASLGKPFAPDPCPTE
jgi:hypothetical protein